MLCNKTFIVFDNISFSITVNGENPFNPNCLAARWKLDETPGLVSLDTLNFFMDCYDPLRLIRFGDSVVASRFIVGRFNGGDKNVRRILRTEEVERDRKCRTA